MKGTRKVEQITESTFPTQFHSSMEEIQEDMEIKVTNISTLYTSAAWTLKEKTSFF